MARENTSHRSRYDYVVVGSGAGGGPLACNLAKGGQRVLLLEAGGDYENYNYQVPVFGLPGYFKGYYPTYSEEVGRERNRFTWAILKAHTLNTAGKVTLRSDDPRDVPYINFRYFDEGNDASGDDLEAVVEGVEFIRRMMSRTSEVIERELVPGESVNTREQVREFVRNEAWGHHASCTCKMGLEDDEMAVVDSNFRVHGTRNLRVVDASVFPRIPGFFIVTAVYMISEKASDVILADAAAGPGFVRRMIRRVTRRKAR